MSIRVNRGPSDATVDAILGALAAYQDDHPNANIDAYRYSPVSVRLRIIDPDFAGLSKSDRSRIAWSFLDGAPDEAQSDISMMLLLTPEETSKSMGNLEFEEPVPCGF